MTHLLLSTRQLGQLLLSARKRKRLSQGELGALVGLSQARISQMEREPDTVSAPQLLALMAALDLELLVQDKAPKKVLRQQSVAQTPEWAKGPVSGPCAR